MWRRTFISRLSLRVAALGFLGLPSVRAQIASESQRAAVLASVSTLFSAVESLDAAGFKALLTPAMIGQAQIRDALSHLLASEQQIRYQLVDTTVAPSNQAFVVKGRWERRFLVPGSTQPQVRSGTVSLTFEWTEGAWRLASLAGDNPFEHGQREHGQRR